MSARLRARTAAALTAAAFVLLAGGASAASAATVGATKGGTVPNVLPPPDPVAPVIYLPVSPTIAPPGFGINARQAVRVASGTAVVRRARSRHPDLHGTAFISPLGLRSGTFYHWDVIYRSRGDPLVEVEMTGGGKVLETQTAPDVGWELLRGYPGVLGGKLNAPYVWLPLCLLFVAPFFDPRRIFRLLHLDLAMLLAFGISQYFFAAGRPDISVPLVYPFLLYVVVRMAYAALRPTRRRGALIPYATTQFLVVGIVVLLALRIAFGVLGSHTFDVSTAGVVGAYRIEHGLQLYVNNDRHGDTYGPINYLMYIPFERLFHYSYAKGAGDAARAATLAFDLLTVAGLFLLGRRARPGPPGRRLGAALAFAWCAFPYTSLVIASNVNDTLVPLFIVFALVFVSSAPARGFFTGLGAMAKFAPLPLVPALMVGRGPFRLRPVLIASGVFALVCAGLIGAFLPAGGLSEFWKTTLGFQLSRTSPLSLWVRDPSLDWLRHACEAVVVLMALAAAFVPRRRTLGQLAAICAGLLAAFQIPTNYWIYFYLVWFAPFMFLALFEEYRELGPAEAQGRVMRALLKDVRISRPSAVTATKSSILTPSDPGR